MSRDELSTKIYETNVTKKNYQEDFGKTTIQINGVKSSEFHKEYTDIRWTLSNSSKFTREEFYKSYNPEVGLNTATVLGGILVLLVIYVIYRTRCRKGLLKLVQNCSMKYFPDEYVQDDYVKPGSANDQPHLVDAEWISERAKMIWKEREALSRDADEENVLIDEIKTEADTRDIALKIGDGDDTAEEIDPEISLPDATDEDFRHATMQWVQNVKELDPTEKHLNGLILRIPPDLLSTSAKIRSNFHSLRDYGEASVFETISNRNKSVPLLVEMQNLVKEEYAKRDLMNNNTELSFITRAPLASQEEFGSDVLTMNGPMDTMNNHKVPLDICPIVKVQHYHSRSKRRLTSISRSSSEDSSCSDAGSLDVTEKRRVSFGQTKYTRLSTTENNVHTTDMNHVTKPSIHRSCQLCRSEHRSCATESFETNL